METVCKATGSIDPGTINLEQRLFQDPLLTWITGVDGGDEIQYLEVVYIRKQLLYDFALRSALSNVFSW